jgi:hypothetical protein
MFLELIYRLQFSSFSLHSFSSGLSGIHIDLKQKCAQNAILAPNAKVEKNPPASALP